VVTVVAKDVVATLGFVVDSKLHHIYSYNPHENPSFALSYH
jgi:hypothetical protein